MRGGAVVVDPWSSVFADPRVFGNRFLESYHVNYAKTVFFCTCFDLRVLQSFKHGRTKDFWFIATWC